MVVMVMMVIPCGAWVGVSVAINVFQSCSHHPLCVRRVACRIMQHADEGTADLPFLLAEELTGVVIIERLASFIPQVTWHFFPLEILCLPSSQHVTWLYSGNRKIQYIINLNFAKVSSARVCLAAYSTWRCYITVCYCLPCAPALLCNSDFSQSGTCHWLTGFFSRHLDPLSDLSLPSPPHITLYGGRYCAHMSMPACVTRWGGICIVLHQHL